MLKVIAQLIYNQTVIGYRIFSHRTMKHHDIALDDFNLIVQDFEEYLTVPANVPSIKLVNRGNLLVSETETQNNVPELTYSQHAVFLGHPELKNTDVKLKLMYNHYNKVCFGGKLPQHTAVEWSTHMTRGAGYCRTIRRRNERPRFLIKMSTHYHQRFTDEVEDTLVHEMIHVLHPNDSHGPKFLATMHDLNNRFGFTLAVKATGRAKVNYVYVCVSCGYRYERVRKINLSTSSCGAKSCRGDLYLEEEEDEFIDNTDWGAGREW